MRLCSKCQETKPLTEFYARGKRYPGQFQTWCIPCKKLDAKSAEFRELGAKRYQRTRVRRDALHKAWTLANPEKSKEIKERWRKKNPEVGRESAKRYARKHPVKVRARNKARRAREKGVTVCDFTPTQWWECLAEFNHQCAYCAKSFTEQDPATQDHLIPLVRGGNHTASNIAPSCRSCNSRKRTRTAEEFIKIAALENCPLVKQRLTPISSVPFTPSPSLRALAARV